MPKHKYGKQLEMKSFPEIQERIDKVSKSLTVESLAYFVLLYYCGVRKSEGYERTVEDCTLSPSLFIVDFGARKKGGEKVPPLEIPLEFPFMDILVKQYLRASKQRASKKLLIRSEHQKNESYYKKARWLFPKVNRSWALTIVKTVLGDEYYPHFLRLNRITEIAGDPSSNLTRLKSFTGIKTIRALEAYMGTSRNEQKRAFDFMKKQISEKDQKESEGNSVGMEPK